MPSCADALHHDQHAVEILAVLHLAPGSAHAEARRAGRPWRACALASTSSTSSSVSRLQPGLLGVMRRLRAIGAVLGAGAGLDRKQARELDRAVVVMAAMHLARLVDQLEQRHRQQANDLVPASNRGGSRRLRRLSLAGSRVPLPLIGFAVF